MAIIGIDDDHQLSDFIIIYIRFSIINKVVIKTAPKYTERKVKAFAKIITTLLQNIKLTISINDTTILNAVLVIDSLITLRFIGSSEFLAITLCLIE